MRELVVNGVYKHFKNKYYIVIGTAYNSDDECEYVIYRALYGEHKTWIRRKDEFLSEVDNKKYPEVKQKYRFDLVNFE